MNRAIASTIVGRAPAHPSIFARRLTAAAIFALAVTGCSPKAKIDRILEGGKKYYDAGDYEKAKAEYIKVLRVDSKNADAMRQLGLIWFEEGAALKAFPFLSRTLELRPDDTLVRLKRALIYLDFGDHAKARAEAVELLGKASNNDDALILLADASTTKAELDDAEQELKKHTEPDRAGFHIAQSDLFARRGDSDSAEKEILKALVLDPKSVSALLAKGAFCLLRKDVAGAGDAFKAASDLAPLRSAARMKYAGIKVFTVRPEGAAILKDITDKAPDFVPAWKARAEMALGDKKPDEALDLLEKVFAVDPANYEGRMLQAEIVMEKKDSKKAITLLQSVRAAYPKIPTVMYQLARAYLLDGNPNQALAALNDAVAAKPDYADAVLLLGEVKLKLGDAVGNVSLMQGLLKAHPDLIPAQLQLSQTYTSLGRLDEAAAIYRDQIKNAPKSSGPYVLLGSILADQGKMTEAREVLDKAQEFAPDNLLATYQLVSLDLRDKNFKAAHQRVAAQLQKKPNSASALFLEGRIFSAEQNWDEAEKTLLKTIQLNAKADNARHELANVYLSVKKFPEALAQLEKVEAANPDDTQAFMTSAEIHEKLNELLQARETYEKLLSKKASFVPAMNNLACLYAQTNEMDKAYEMATKARTLQAGDAIVADTLGWIVYQRADYPQALTLLSESAGKKSDSSEIQYHLGMAAYMMGQSDIARKALKLASASTSDFKGKSEIQAKLAILGDSEGAGAPTTASDLETIVQKQPGDPLLWSRLAEAYEQQGAADKASHAYEETLKINPKLAPATLRLAQLEAGPLKNPAKAMELAAKARELAPNDPRIAAILGSLAYQAGEYPKAYGLLRESAGSLANDPGVLHDLALAAYSQGKVDEARQSMQRLLTAAAASPHAKDATAFLTLTALGQETKDLEAQTAKMGDLLPKDSNDGPVLMVRAALHVQRGETKEAENLYNTVLGRYPDFSPAQKWLAALYSAEPTNLPKAYDLAVKARKTLPDDPELAQILAGLAYERNEFSYAAQLFEESARKQPLDAKGLCYLGKSLLAGGHSSEGKAALEKALAAGLQEPLVSDAKNELKKLEKK